MFSVALVTVVLTLGTPSLEDTPADGRLFARVTTTDGRVVEGYLRWDRNEGHVWDFLDGAREIPKAVLREAERLDPEYGAEMRRERSLVAFGVRITWAEDDLADPTRVPSAIRLARVAELVPQENGSAILELRDGTSVELAANSSDLGRSVRDVVVEPPGAAPITLAWSDLERVAFLSPPADASAPSEMRLRGTVRTRAGVEVSGLISWDLEEAFPSDLLDGRADGDDRAIPFADIRSIEPLDPRSARVRTVSGAEVVLRGTNDVDRRNRGIEIVDPRLGRVVVGWDALAELRLDGTEGLHRTGDEAGAGVAEALGRQGPIRGTVEARDGRVLTGAIRWGHEEEALWELLDGRLEDADVGVEFAAVAEIQPEGLEGARVLLRSGRSLRLHGTDDVGVGHRGVFVTPEGGATRLVRWADLRRVVLDP